MAVVRQATEQSTAELTRKHVLIPWEAQGGASPPVIDHADGCYLYTADGTRVLDFSSGLVCVNAGHNHPKIVEAIRRQAGRLTYANPGYSTDVRARLAEMLSQISPGRKLVKTFFTTAGAEANENAMKIARLYTGRHKILTSFRGYHGSTYGSMTLSGDSRRWALEPGVSGVVHFFTPYPYRSPFGASPDHEAEAGLEHLRNILLYEGAENIAAILLETIVGSNGVIVPPDGYLEGVRDLCDRHGILLMFDEVMAGFGRTGKMFACEHWNVVPDVISFAKGVTSAYVPLGGVMVTEPIARYFDDHVLWAGLTYSGHPLACAAGCATLEVYESEGLVERSQRMGRVLGDRLRDLADRHRVIGDIRGKGLFWGVELVKDRTTKEPWVEWNSTGGKQTKQLLSRMFANGAYMLGRWNCFIAAPPLTVTEEQIDEGVRALDRTLADVEG